jgi:hypothetical protein
VNFFLKHSKSEKIVRYMYAESLTHPFSRSKYPDPRPPISRFPLQISRTFRKMSTPCPHYRHLAHWIREDMLISCLLLVSSGYLVDWEWKVNILLIQCEEKKSNLHYYYDIHFTYIIITLRFLLQYSYITLFITIILQISHILQLCYKTAIYYKYVTLYHLL